MNMSQAPALIDSAYVRAHAEIGPDVRFTGKQCIYVGSELAGPAAKLAICENGPNDFLLLLCDEEWNSYACAAATTAEELLSSAERWYEGVGKRWAYTNFTPEEDRKNAQEYFAGEECSFCGKLPNEVEHIFVSEKAVICSSCVANMHAALHSIETGA
jgi:hypothetical protein